MVATKSIKGSKTTAKREAKSSAIAPKQTGREKKLAGSALRQSKSEEKGIDGEKKASGGAKNHSTGATKALDGRSKESARGAAGVLQLLAQRGFDAGEYGDRRFVRPAPKAVAWPAPQRTGRGFEDTSSALDTVYVRLLVAGAFLRELSAGLPTRYSVLDVAWNAYDALTRPAPAVSASDSAQPEIDLLHAKIQRVRNALLKGTAPGDPAREALQMKTVLTPTRELALERGPVLLDAIRALAASGRFPAITSKIVDDIASALEAARDAVERARTDEASSAAERIVGAEPRQRALDVLLEQLDLLRMSAALHLDEYALVSEFLSAPIERSKKRAKPDDDEEEDKDRDDEKDPGGVAKGGGAPKPAG